MRECIYKLEMKVSKPVRSWSDNQGSISIRLGAVKTCTDTELTGTSSLQSTRAYQSLPTTEYIDIETIQHTDLTSLNISQSVRFAIFDHTALL